MSSDFFHIAIPPAVFLQFSQNLSHMIYVPVCKKLCNRFSKFWFLKFLANFINFRSSVGLSRLTVTGLCSTSCTGFLCGSTSCSKLQLSSTGPCPAIPRVTWPMTVSLLPTPVSDNCVLPTLKHSLSVRRAAVLETGHLPLQDHKSGTVRCPISDYVGCHTASSGGYWRHF